MFVFLCELFVPSTKLYCLCTLNTGKNSAEIKREDDSRNVDVSPNNENTGTSMFYILVLLIIVYFIIRLPNICQNEGTVHAMEVTSRPCWKLMPA